MITIRRELHPEQQDEVFQSRHCSTVTHPTYTSVQGRTLLELRAAPGASQMWRSEDNGRTWALADDIPSCHDNGDGTWARNAFGPLVLDASGERLIRFRSSTLFTASPDTLKTYQQYVKHFIANSYRAYYRLSFDGGRTWDDERQLIESGSEYDAVHWAHNVTHLQGAAVLGEPPPFHHRDDGRLTIPCQIRTSADSDRYGTIQAGRFYARWNPARSDYEWESGGRVPGGGCEQAVAVLRDGRMLNILRVQGQVEPYFFDVWLRPLTLSADGGDTWSRPEPLCFRDGGGLTTPRAWTQVIRSERNGRLYWIANILPPYEETARLRQQFPGRADPRYPLQIVEIDEHTLTLKRETLTVIQDREPGETHWVRFSNFFSYNDRETGELVLLMQKSYCEHQQNLEAQPHPGWRFRITVPD